MATVRLGPNQAESIDFDRPYWWSGSYHVYTDPTAYAALDETHVLGFTGQFTYDSQHRPSGTASTVDFETPEGSVYSITGVSLSMPKVQSYIDDGLGGRSFLAYVLAGDDTVYADDANNYINAFGGNDLVRMSAVSGRADGGSGTDTLVFATPAGHGVEASLLAGRATDLARNSAMLVAGFENLTGSSNSDVLQGNAGANRIDGGGGALDLVSYAGLASAVTVNLATGSASGGGGTDTLVNLDGAIGGQAADRLTGSAASDWLEGRAGADTLPVRRLAADGADVMVEAIDAGIDTVRSDAHAVLAANIEHLVLTGEDWSHGTGNALANRIEGNLGNNWIDGGAGRDTLVGGRGNDTYVVEPGDSIVELAGQGWDLVMASGSLTLGDALEGLTLTGSDALNGVGNALGNRLTGNAGANVLDGKAGADTMIGGLGDDIFVVDNVSDSCVDSAGGGTDLIRCAASHHRMGSYIESLVLTGTSGQSVVGNALGNRITSGSGSDTLDGGGGLDTLVGGAGDDLFIVGGGAAVALEAAGGGTDEVWVMGASYVLGANIENIRVGPNAPTGASITGNALANHLTGSSDLDTLNGAAGADTMDGGGNDDLYVVDHSGDVVIEGASGGYDTVQASVSLSLAAQVEAGQLTGAASVSLAGNALSNRLEGNSGANTLSGGAGADTIDGGAGIDTISYAQATAGVTVNLALHTGAGEGADQLINIEAVIGSALIDTLRGDDGVNTFTGSAGADRFQFDSLLAADVVTDFAHGVDRLQFDQSSLSIGDADLVIDGATTISAPGGHTATAELVIASTALSGSITASAVAGAIGPATSAYAVGQTALFVVHNATDSAVYLFTSAGHDASVSTTELVRLAWLSHQTALSASDVGFIA
jgi:Ca2+-binding RTX toxin-like protein